MPAVLARYMTRLTCLTIACLCVQPAWAEEQQSPYTATIAVDGTAVYAGPGAHYYTTAELPAGTEVQVYEHTPSGFCAVRPPAGSFSWLPADAARIVEPGVAEVTRDQAPARVGSLMHARRDAVHVRLNAGERVRVLSETEIQGVRWLQIAPPSGEFRWVKRSELSSNSRSATPETPHESRNDSGWVHATAHTQPAVEEPPRVAPAVQETGAAPPANPAMDATAPAITGDFAQRLSALDVALARQVAELPTLWRLDGLEQQAAAMMTEAQTEQQRAAVRAFAARVDRFATLANRYKATRGVAPPVTLTRSRVPSSRTAPLIQRLPAGAPTPGFDAQGVLRPVVSKRPGAPQYALVDQQGKIVSFVSASPNLNLTPLIGTRVAVQGSKGFMPEYQHQHLTAARVTPLGSRLR